MDTSASTSDAKPLDAPSQPAVPAAITVEPPTPEEPPPTLLEKLSAIEEDAAKADTDIEEPADEPADEADFAEDEEDDEADPADEPGPLTLSLMELQAKEAAKPKTAQIRAFPWLRG
ncbi:MAG: hypothetical protein HC850_03385 [Rhodomicrobium sp.]|nr:hypothetical protein [Rhodomicrobium sp.]